MSANTIHSDRRLSHIWTKLVGMTKDDKLLRETVLAELKRRRVLSGEPPERARRTPADEARTARPEGEGREQVTDHR